MRWGLLSGLVEEQAEQRHQHQDGAQEADHDDAPGIDLQMVLHAPARREGLACHEGW